MNPDIIEFLCKSHSFISGTPIKIFYDNKLQNSYGDYSYILDIDLTEPYYQQLINTDKLINYIVTPELLIIGMMKEKSSPITILVGPMCTGNMPENTVHKIITSGLYPLRLDQINALSEYLQMLPKLHIDHLISILCALYASINQELISVNEIIKPDAEYEIIADVDRNLLAEEEKTSFHGLQRRNPHEFEAEMMFCIKHGLTDQLCKLVGKSSLKQAGTLAYDTLRNYKNAIIILNSLSIRAAIAGG
ncbi:MAG TPA: hypothetical protein VN131_04105, partial [Mobilitalea sp.]|nr:hypothetical protein [Mobilitalea sp.]